MTVDLMDLLRLGDGIPVAELIDQGITWTEQPFDGDAENTHDAKGYVGVVGNWRIVIASFDIEDQGFPPGSRGHDGTAVMGGSIIRLTRDQAKAFCLDAEENVGGAA